MILLTNLTEAEYQIQNDLVKELRKEVIFHSKAIRIMNVAVIRSRM